MYHPNDLLHGVYSRRSISHLNNVQGYRLCRSHDDNMRPNKRLCQAPSPPASRQCNVPPPILLDEVIVEILSWVPVKSLVRFRCVCKSWKSLFSDPHFVKLHLERSSTKVDFGNLRLTSLANYNDRVQRRVVSYSVRSLFDNPSSAIAEDLCYPFEREDDHYWVVGSCNGLLCMVCFFLSEVYEEYTVYLWNPATRLRYQKEPWLNINWHSDRYGSPKFGFGYDLESDTYKVVVVHFDRNAKDLSQKTLVKVYNMGDNCWRKIESFPVVPSLRANGGEFVSGSLNWMGVRNFGSGVYEWHTITIDELVIVSLDLGKETYRQLSLPRDLDEVPHVEPTLGVLRDCLCLSHDHKRTHFVVWQMKEFGVERSWTQLVNVSYLDLQTGCLEFGCTILPICISEDGNVLMVSHFAESRAILYNWRDNKVERSEILNNMKWVNPKVYVESLVLPCRKFS